MSDFQKIDIHLDCENPSLSTIRINEREVTNILSLIIKADAEKIVVEFQTIDRSIERTGVDVWIRQICPNCKSVQIVAKVSHLADLIKTAS